MAEPDDPYLNEVARRCFRDTADQDYIAARLAFRAHLYPQFLWLGLQAVEKLLKGILLFNRVVAKNISHDLGKAIKRIDSNCPFRLRLSKDVSKFIEYLDTYGRFRYLETSWHVGNSALHFLDLAVWEVRRYCQGLNVDIDLPDGTKRNLLGTYLAEIEMSEKRPPQRFRISSGLLEDVLSNGHNPARAPLIWKNLRFGVAERRSVSMPQHFQAANSPLSLHPEIMDAVDKYIFIPLEVREAYRLESARRAEST